MQWVADGQTWSRDRTRLFIESALEMQQNHGYCQWPLIEQVEGGLIGFCGFVNTGNGHEIGWRLAQGYWRQGLATEAARAVLAHGIETLGFPRVIATVQAANLASIRVVEKLGMALDRRRDRNGREVMFFSND